MTIIFFYESQPKVRTRVKKMRKNID